MPEVKNTKPIKEAVKSKTAVGAKKTKKPTAKKRPVVKKAVKVEVKLGITRKSPHVLDLKEKLAVKASAKIEKRKKPQITSVDYNDQLNKVFSQPKEVVLTEKFNFPVTQISNTQKIRVNLAESENKIFPVNKKYVAAKRVSNKKTFTELFFVKFKKQNKRINQFYSGDVSGMEIEDIFAPPKFIEFGSLVIPKNWARKITVFITALLIFISPLQAFTFYQDLQVTKEKVLLMTDEAINDLRLGQKAAFELDLNGAHYQFTQARANFSTAQQEISSVNSLAVELLKLWPAKYQEVNAGVALLEAGEISAQIGEMLANGARRMLEVKDAKQYYGHIVAFEKDLKEALRLFEQAKKKVSEVNREDIPAEHQQSFDQAISYMDQAGKGLTDLYALNHLMVRALGDQQWQRYLVVFLNNNELRGTGGFMGSYALVDIDRGEIKNLEMPGGGTYDVQGQLVARVLAPEPMHLLKPRWEFQDSNWWPDFPTAARKIQWFHQNAKGPSVDGVIVLTSTFMERLLEVFGPIDMSEYGRIIDSSNFTLETQKIVELEYDREENRPKQFLADMAPKLIEKIFAANSEQLQALIPMMHNAMSEKHVLLYFNNPQSQNIVSSLGWAGEIKKTEGDFLSVVHTNLAGGKTDGVIDETIKHHSAIQPDGSIINTVTLIRKHNGVPGENVFTGVQNNSYVRFYVPAGSTLIEAKGFERPDDKFFKTPDPDLVIDSDLAQIEKNKTKHQPSNTDVYQEFGKTVFGNWLQLKAGTSQEASIVYRLPLKVSVEPSATSYYSLLAQKQHGSLGSVLQSTLSFPESLKIFAKFPENVPADNQSVNFSTMLTTDQFYSVALIAQSK